MGGGGGYALRLRVRRPGGAVCIQHHYPRLIVVVTVKSVKKKSNKDIK